MRLDDRFHESCHKRGIYLSFRYCATIWMRTAAAIWILKRRPVAEIKNHQLSWWFDGEPLKAVLKDSATFGMGLWDH